MEQASYDNQGLDALIQQETSAYPPPSSEISGSDLLMYGSLLLAVIAFSMMIGGGKK